MVKRIKLEWDDWNVNHIAKHGVSRREVEVVIEDPKKIIKKHRKRYAVTGSAFGRILYVILERIEGERYYVVTARDATTAEKRIYKRKKK